MATSTMDLGFIAASYSLPEPTLQTLLDAPTAELVKDFLQKIEGKARETELLHAEKLRSDVELETAVRSRDARVKQYKDSADKSLKEVEELRRKLANEENSRAAIESELQNLKSSSTTSSSESQALRSRISSLETSNSDALALLETKTKAYDSLADELSTQQQKLVALRREVSDLEEKNQTAENASMAAKFKEQNLQQEVELLKKNNDWHEEELKRRSTEHTKLRKEKGAQVAELQRELEDKTQTCEGLQSNELKLRNHIAEVDRKLEEAYEQIQFKTDDAVKSEQSLRAERDNALRLAELQKKSAETARARLQELERAVDQIKEDAAIEIGNLQADINAERIEKEAAERRVAELESQIESMQTELSTAQQAITAPPMTPRRGVNGISRHGSPAKDASPGIFASPGGSRLKSGLSVTQLYAQYSKAKAELENERRRNQELSTNMDEMLQELENRSPEIEELRLEHDRLTKEVQNLAQMLENAHNDRDAARKETRKWIGTSEGLSKERDILRQQIRDLSAQLKVVVVELQAREQGLGPLSDVDQAQLERLARGELEEGALNGTDTSKFISQRLTIFHNVADLQKQNVKLLGLVRKLGEEMEGEEAKAKRNQHEQDASELEDLRTRIVEYQDMVQSITARSESYIQERDMFRRMLAHRGQLPKGDLATAFGQSVDSSGAFLPPATPSRQSVTGAEQSQDSQALSDYAKLVKEMQQHFDAYRAEAATDQGALKQQADRLSKEKVDLQSEIGRISSQITLASERYNMLQSNYNMLRAENGELQKRTRQLADNAASQDVRTQQVAEELVEARGLADSMRHDTANLKAERDLLKRIESRLTEDNQSLVEERSRLNKMISELQRLQNERELADSETRRKLQARLEILEAESSTAKRKLDEEIDQSRKAALRREYEQEQNRTRIEDLLKGSSNAKEELVAAKTQRDQLQARVDEMKIELRNAEEKALALQPRPSTRPAAAETDENALTREQEMAIEIADLNRDLQLKIGELQQAEEEIEQYKAIAQAAEEALESNTETTEQYRESTDREIAEKESKIQDLEKRVEEISSELATTNNELSEIRTQHEDNASRLNDQKATYESELARLRDESERLAETARVHQEDLKAQAKISQQAQQHYEDELVKHAEAATNLQKIRGEFNQLKSEVATYKAEATASKASLSQSEESWAETRTRYEKEITDLKNRREDVIAQNRRVHQQLEEVSSQITALRNSRAAASEEDAHSTIQEGNSDNSQEIIRYLRQEKEIVDMQYELSIQEAKRLKQQLDHANTQLDQTREKLEQERLSHDDREQNAASHSKLIQTVNDLNLFRESNSSLRNEARSAQEKLAAKLKEVEELTAQLEPIQTRVREVEHDLESKESEIKLLQEDRDRWQKRTQDIMQRYDRVDPAELEALKTQITDLQAEKEALLAAQSPLQDQINGIPEQIRLAQEESAKNWEERRAKLIDQSKKKVREMILEAKAKDEQISSATAETATVSAELTSVKDELVSVKEQLAKTIAARDDALTQANGTKAVPDDGAEEGQIEESAQKGVSEEVKAELEARLSSAESRADNEAANAVKLQQEIQTLQSRIRELEEQVTTLQHNLEAANAQISSLQNAPQPIQTEVSDQETEKLQADLNAAQQEVEELKSKAALAASISNISSDESKPVVEQVAEQVEKIRADLQAQHDDRVRAAEEKLQVRADNMKKQLSTKLASGKQTIREQLQLEHETAMKQLMSDHQREIERIKTETAQASNAVINPTPAEPAAPPAWKPSQADIKELLENDASFKNMLNRNVQQKIEQQKVSLMEQVKQEEEKTWVIKLEEANKTSEAAKEKAVIAARELESKKWSLKFGMTDNRAKTAQAKIEVVEKAATDTPERPVGEVWAIAKIAKPAPTAVPPQGATSTPAQPATNANAPATPQIQQPGQVASTTPQGPPPARQQPNVQQPAVQNAQKIVPPTSVPQNPFAGQATSAAFGLPTAPGGRGSGLPVNPFSGQRPNIANNAPTGPGQNPSQNSSIGRGIPQPSTGTGPAALRGILGGPGMNQPLSTGIPRPGGANGQRGGRGRGGPQQAQNFQNHQQSDVNIAGTATRGGSNIGRGNNRGRGGNRGGNQNVQTSGLPQQNSLNTSVGNGQNSPGGGKGGPMNAAARQFIPGAPGASASAGNKRPHDGDGANAAEKKFKGGASGGAE